MQTIKDKIKEILEQVFNKENGSPKTIEQLLNEISPSIDNIILDYSKNRKLKPFGGEIKLSVHERNSNKIVIHWDLYFLDENQKYQKVSSEKTISKSMLDDQSYQKIKKNSPVFVIDPPK
jgi:hypothetical protein